jgi:hypothetical protein
MHGDRHAGRAARAGRLRDRERDEKNRASLDVIRGTHMGNLQRPVTLLTGEFSGRTPKGCNDGFAVHVQLHIYGSGPSDRNAQCLHLGTSQLEFLRPTRRLQVLSASLHAGQRDHDGDAPRHPWTCDFAQRFVFELTHGNHLIVLLDG